ncbi:sensor histidine kinase [Microbispora sp. ATCC PTA-5024]|uniref:sensor histidine kinase n=1 Tax=Microbispora sp. ATCC PTA-5024 TaxID=316330 RepID=UPI0012EDE17F|nr:nitrate- and nitrite sensing domain-containing protein [Microbispora sp. ATCC PTA-5024]
MRTATVESGRRIEQKPPPLPAGSRESVAEPPAQPASSDTGSAALKNWRVRTRLLALVLVPTLVAVTLGGLRVATSIGSAAEYQRVRDAAEFVASIGTFTHELQLERDLTARYVAADRRGSALLSLIRNQQDAVDAAAQQVRARAATAGAALGDIGRGALTRLVDRLGELTALRRTVLESRLPALPAIDKYSLYTADALRLYDVSVQGVADEAVSASFKAMGSLARAQEEVSKQRALLAAAVAKGGFETAELDAFTAARAREVSERDAFTAQASPSERQLFSDTVTGQKVDRAEYLRAFALSLARDGQPLRRLTADGDAEGLWFDAISETADDMQKVGAALGASVVRRSQDLQQSDRNVAAVNVGMVVVVLVLVLLITAVMARSLVRPLRRLRSEALEIAGHRLPDLVQRLRESDSSGGPPEVAPIGVDSADEVGEVARAFDEVHREAVRLAGDEAQLRSNISAMFVNLSRRTQTLVERQIALIDGLEQGEQDEQRLGNLFKLDHLATRMRRNSENLLVLAGQEPARRWSQPVEITDVIRASLSEVEGYERVVLNFPSDVAIAGQAVNDVIHLLAELVENALSFSARDTRVIVSGNRIDGGGVMVSVTDSGIGMTPEEIAQTNWRLAHPPVVDVSVSRRMGLFVVGRLAARNGIRVQLRPHDGGGLTAMVLLPESLMGRPAQVAPAYTGAFAPSWSPQPEQSVWSRPQQVQQVQQVHQVQQVRQVPVQGAITRGDPRNRLRSRRYDVPDDAATGPMPSVSGAAPAITGPFGAGTGPVPVMGAPAPAPPDEFLPIFASVESAWFQRSPGGDEGQSGWQRAADADAGWQAAASAVEKPAWDGKTTSGLPKRVPKANLVPGSAEPVTPPAAPAPVLSPDRARSRLSSLQQGVRQGRAVARGEISEDQGYPTRSGDQA